jgi:tetratricopeptide (TPR) repeat protein
MRYSGIVAFFLTLPVFAQQDFDLPVHVTDMGGHDLTGYRFRAEGRDFISEPSHEGGITHIKLHPNTKPGDTFVLQVVGPPVDVVIEVPWRARGVVPSPGNQSELPVVLVTRAQDEYLRHTSGNALVSVNSKVNATKPALYVDPNEDTAKHVHGTEPRMKRKPSSEDLIHRPGAPWVLELVFDSRAQELRAWSEDASYRRYRRGNYDPSFLWSYRTGSSQEQLGNTQNKQTEDEVVDSAIRGGLSSYGRGGYSESAKLFQRAAELRPDDIIIMTNWGLSLVALGDYGSAEPLLQRALAKAEALFGMDHPLVATTMNNLASLLQARGEYAEAENFYKLALAIREKTLGPDSPDTATSLNNLASLLQAKGDFTQAEDYYKRALAIKEKILGPDSPDTATALNNLASLLQAKGDFAQAEDNYKRALTIREKILGRDSPDTATSLNNLASLLQAKGDLTQAEDFYKRALAIRQKILGSDSPDTAASLDNLASLLQDKKDYVDAEMLYERAIRIREKILGPDSPNTAASLNNLASLFQAKGDYARAEMLYRRALEMREKALGPDSPDTATSWDNLAGLFQAKGDFVSAEECYNQALEIRKKTSGPNSPDTATTMNNLAGSLMSERRFEQAEVYYRRALVLLCYKVDSSI